MDHRVITNREWGEYHSIAVILGARVRADGTPSPALMRRIEYGCHLYHLGRAKTLLLSGGAVGSPHPEAEVMADHARRLGVPAASLLIESQARTTRDNARHACQMLLAATPHPPGPITVITDAYHLPRSWLVFRVIGRRSGLRFRFAACPLPPGGWRRRSLWLACLREIPALLLDLLRCWRVPPPTVITTDADG